MDKVISKPILNDREEHLDMVMRNESLNATGTPCANPPSFTQRSNAGTPGSTRLQTASVGDCVNAGYRYMATVYGVTVSVTAVDGDTPASIRLKMADKINAMTAQQWNAAGSAPAAGTVGFKPSALAASDHIKFILDYQHQFAFSASGSVPATAPASTPPASSPLNPMVLTTPSTGSNTSTINPMVLTLPPSGTPDPLQPISSVEELTQQPIVNEYAAQPEQVSAPASSALASESTEEAKPQTVINAIFPPATMPYGVSLGGGGGAGGGSEPTPEQTALYVKARNFFWITVIVISATAFIFHNKNVNLAGGKA